MDAWYAVNLWPKYNKMNKMTPERAAQICNDIHEGMCKASRAELMECVSFYAIRSTYLYSDVISAYTAMATHGLENMLEFQKRWKNRDEGKENT